jgi:HAD superfamily hydrolase (TIGR01484 family)
VKGLEDLDPATCRGIRGVFCDIDDTLSWGGKLVPAAFLGLSRLQEAGLRVVPVTGRPGGWVDHLARMWPVDGVVGENGGLWIWLEHGRMVRRFAQDPETRRQNRARLDAIAGRILEQVPGAALASDQAYRDLDLAVDFCEDVVPELPQSAVDAIVAEFRAVGATCKVSSIHVNGWFGTFDKLAGCRSFALDRWGVDLDAERDAWLYVGDSPNDEPMFAFFPVSVGVANVSRFLDRMKHHPAYVTSGVGGHGFAELVDHLLANR